MKIFFASLFVGGSVNTFVEMRKLFLFAVSIVIFGVMTVCMPMKLTAYAQFFPKDATVTICCKQTQLPCTNVGCGNFVRCDVSELQVTLEKCSGVDGISIKFCGDGQTFENLQHRLRLQHKQSVVLDGLTVVCGFSNKFCGGVSVDGQKVNVQIAFDGETITIGSPLILDGY